MPKQQTIKQALTKKEEVISSRRSTRSGGGGGGALPKETPTKQTPKKAPIPKKAESPKKVESPKKAEIMKKEEAKKDEVRKSSRTPVKKEPLDADEPYKATQKSKTDKANVTMAKAEALKVKSDSPKAKVDSGKSPSAEPTKAPESPKAAEKKTTEKRKIETTPKQVLTENKRPKMQENSPQKKVEKLYPQERVEDIVSEPEMEVLPAGLAVEEVDEKQVTDNNCGRCINCNRRPCQECSHCKRADFENCIDKYCMNQRDGRDQRLAMRELYMQMVKNKHDPDPIQPQEHQRKQKIVSKVDPAEVESKSPVKSVGSKKTETLQNLTGNVVFVVEDGTEFENNTETDEDPTMSIEERVEKIMSNIKKPKSKLVGEGNIKYEMAVEESTSESKKARSSGYVYGASSNSKKLRRCGECEGCMREDCGKCEICKDKPKFGGMGRLKKACAYRKCTVVGRKSR